MRARSAILTALLVAALAVPAPAMTNDTASILGLIAKSPGWSIDRTIAAPGQFDAKTHPFVAYKDETQVGGFVSPEYVAMGMLIASGTQVMAVPLDSGGSGGVFTQLIYAQSYEDKAPYFAGVVGGTHLAVHVLRDAIEATYPDQSLDAPNCCPKGYVIERYTIVNHKLKLLSSRKVKTL